MIIFKNIVNLSTSFFAFILVISLSFGAIEYIESITINKFNIKIQNDELISHDDYEELSLYSSAYLLGKQGEYENSIEKYNMLLKLFPKKNNIDVIYFNIGTVYLRDALSKPLTDDGKLSIENFQKLQSAVIAYEKVLGINPLNELAKFNLSILYSSMPKEPSKIISEQAVQELSNIPIGLP